MALWIVFKFKHGKHKNEKHIFFCGSRISSGLSQSASLLNCWKIIQSEGKTLGTSKHKQPPTKQQTHEKRKYREAGDMQSVKPTLSATYLKGFFDSIHHSCYGISIPNYTVVKQLGCIHLRYSICRNISSFFFTRILLPVQLHQPGRGWTNWSCSFCNWDVCRKINSYNGLRGLLITHCLRESLQ